YQPPLPRLVCVSFSALYVRRERTALWVTTSLLVLALVVLTVGLLSATRTDNVPASGYYPGIALSFGAFLGIVGIYLVENRRPMVSQYRNDKIISFFTLSSLDLALTDCESAVLSHSLKVKRPPVSGKIVLFYTCGTLNEHCKLQVKSNTCYCCYLYNCERPDYHTHYYLYEGVSSCRDVIHLYRLLWASVVLNVVSLFLGIITAAILGAYKDMKPPPQLAPSPAPPPHILYNPNQHMLSYSGFCPTPQALPAYPNYPIPMQVSSTPCSSEENQSQMPSQGNMQPQAQGATQDPGGYMLTPNAPALYGSSYSPFEKPPPYAC
uniref:Transmembrane protein 255B n=1 Tax=Oryzias latipes TaxID=8090 RepID=A0A3P9L491_ORYLA